MSSVLKAIDWKPYSAILLLLAILIPQLYLYQSLQPIFLFSIAVFVFSISKVNTPKHKMWLLASGLCLFALYFVLQVQSLLLLGFAFMFVYLINLSLARINHIPLFVAFVALPVTSTLLNLVSFNLRLQTTKLVVQFLNICQQAASCDGNVIHFKEQEFGVDDVCSGIAMMHIGLLVALMVLAFIEKRKNRTTSIFQIIVLLSIAVIFIFCTNVLRVFITVFFQIAEETFLHEAVGIACLLIYFVLPFYAVSILFSRKFQPQNAFSQQSYAVNKWTPILVITTSFFVMLFSLQVLKNHTDVKLEAKAIQGYQLRNLKYGVSQYSSDNVLIYVKPEVPFYAADHHPKLCWKGSGFVFSNEKIKQIQNHSIVMAQLVNDKKEKMYSAYWFQYQNKITSDEFVWRWDAMLHHHKYIMINVTTTSEADLEQEIKRFITTSNLYASNKVQ